MRLFTKFVINVKIMLPILVLIFFSYGECCSRILVSKKILNKHLVVDKEVYLYYVLYNIGNLSAINILLEDHDTDNENATQIIRKDYSGIKKVSLLGPGQNVSFIDVRIPKIDGMFKSNSSSVKYQTYDDPTIKVVVSNVPESRNVMLDKAYRRNHCAHYYEWVIFWTVASPMIIVPMAMGYWMKVKYESIYKRKKKRY